MYYIYGLRDPRDSRIKYIGKTMHPDVRLQGHFSWSSSRVMRDWIDELKEDGLRPSMVVLDETANEEMAATLERDHIGLFKFAAKIGGWQLLNNDQALNAPMITNRIDISGFWCKPCKVFITESGIYYTETAVTTQNPVTGDTIYFCPKCGRLPSPTTIDIPWSQYWQPEQQPKV